MGKLKDITGKTFGWVTVVNHDHSGRVKSGGSKTFWKCQCGRCGKVFVTRGESLKTGRVKSCGCFHKEVARQIGRNNAKHGHARQGNLSSEYRSWRSMLERCYRTQKDNFKRYGGRGIVVCDRWRESFENFLTDLGPKPNPTHTLERLDSNGDYVPENCCWASIKTQCRNRITNRIINFEGRSQTAVQWAEDLGIKPATLYNRLSTLGWSEERALTTPVRS